MSIADPFPRYDLAMVIREQANYRKYLHDALDDGRDFMRAQAEAYALHLDRLEMSRHAKLEKRSYSQVNQ